MGQTLKATGYMKRNRNQDSNCIGERMDASKANSSGEGVGEAG